MSGAVEPGSAPDVSVVLPVYNQEDHVVRVVREYMEALDTLPVDYEFVLSVNGSTDASLEVCRRLADDHDRIRVVDSVKGGWGLGVLRGLAVARGGILCYTNCARTAPQDLAIVISLAQRTTDLVVKAHRKSRDSTIRRVGSLLYNLQGRLLFGLPTWDINATPKAFSRSIYERLQLTETGDLLDLQFNLACKDAGILLVEVHTYSWDRVSGRATTGWRSAFRLYAGGFRIWRSRSGETS